MKKLNLFIGATILSLGMALCPALTASAAEEIQAVEVNTVATVEEIATVSGIDAEPVQVLAIVDDAMATPVVVEEAVVVEEQQVVVDEVVFETPVVEEIVEQPTEVVEENVVTETPEVVETEATTEETVDAGINVHMNGDLGQPYFELTNGEIGFCADPELHNPEGDEVYVETEAGDMSQFDNVFIARENALQLGMDADFVNRVAQQALWAQISGNDYTAIVEYYYGAEGLALFNLMLNGGVDGDWQTAYKLYVTNATDAQGGAIQRILVGEAVKSEPEVETPEEPVPPQPEEPEIPVEPTPVEPEVPQEPVKPVDPEPEVPEIPVEPTPVEPEIPQEPKTPETPKPTTPIVEKPAPTPVVVRTTPAPQVVRTVEEPAVRQETEVLSRTWVPQTGEESHMGITMLVFFFAMIGLLLSVVKKQG